MRYFTYEASHEILMNNPSVSVFIFSGIWSDQIRTAKTPPTAKLTCSQSRHGLLWKIMKIM